MSWTHSPERQLAEWMERDGNWRLKALLAAALPDHPLDHEEIGQALLYMEKNPEVKEYHLGKRDGDGYDRMGNRTIRPLAYDEGEFAEPAHAREMASAGDFDERELRSTGVSVDEYMGRTLVSDTTANKDVLWREQLLDTVIQGAEEVQFARDAVNFIEVDTKKGDHPVRGDDVFAQPVAEGAGIEFDELDWDTASWDAEKRGLGAYITEEMRDHALVDIIEQNIRHLGRAVENSLNRKVLNELIDSANEDVSVTTSTTDGIQNTNVSYVFQGRDAIIKDSWPEPDSLVMHNKFELGFAVEGNNNLTFADRAGTDDYLTQSLLPPIAGVDNHFVVPDSVYDGTNTYDWSGSSNDIGAVTYVSDLVFAYMYRDLETKDFDDPIRDLEGANVRAQYDATLGQDDAVATISES